LKFKIVVGIDLCVYPENATKYILPRIQGRHIGLPLRQQKPFIKLVDQIFEKKKDNPEADTGELEGEIDEMVYELYGLSFGKH